MHIDCSNLEELMEWFNSTYPDYAGNEDLAKAVCQRVFGGRQRPRSREYVKIKDVLMSDENVRLATKGIVLSVQKPRKTRKGSYVMGFSIADGTGEVWVNVFADNREDLVQVNAGDEVAVYGRTREYNGKLELVGYEVEVLRRLGEDDDGDSTGSRSGSDEEAGGGEQVSRITEEQEGCLAKIARTIKNTGAMDFTPVISIAEDKCGVGASDAILYLAKMGIELVEAKGGGAKVFKYKASRRR